MSNLTPKQRDLLDFITDYIDENHYSPSMDEMAGYLCLKSKSGVHRMIVELEYRGHIRRLKHRARAITIIDQKAPLVKETAICSVPFMGYIYD